MNPPRIASNEIRFPSNREEEYAYLRDAVMDVLDVWPDGFTVKACRDCFIDNRLMELWSRMSTLRIALGRP